MSFFDMYNGAMADVKPSYRRNSELPLFIPMKVVKIEPAVTSIGPTHQVNVEYDNVEFFFYLNASDHAKILEFNGISAIHEMINRQEHPFAVEVRKRSGLGTLILPSSALLIDQHKSNSMICESQNPVGIANEFNFEGLAAMQISLSD